MALVRRCALVALLLLAVPARPVAAAPVEVTLVLSVGHVAAEFTSCDVGIERGSDGLAVLDAAVEEGCIADYKVVSTPFGNFLDCITPRGGGEICSVAGGLVTFWAMSANGATTDYGVDGFSAEPGDSLEFTYTTWLTCAAGCII